MGFFKKFIKAITNPANIIAAIGIAIAITAGPVGWAMLGTSAFWTTVAIVATTTAAVSALAPMPRLPNFSDFLSEAQGRSQMIKQPAVPRRVIYGTMKVSGVLGFVTTFKDTANNDNYLRMIILLAGHEINAIQKIYINDDEVTFNTDTNYELVYQVTGLVNPTSTQNATKYNGLVSIWPKFGSVDQTYLNRINADTFNDPVVWDENYRLRGIAYVYCQLKFDRKTFPQGIPNISFQVQGKKVFDPRNSSTAFSANPALIIRDYLTSSAYGFGASSDEISDASIITAANICDEDITLVGGSTEKRYELHGSFQTSGSPKSILGQLLTSCGGIVTYTNGLFKIKVAKYVSPSVTLDEGDLRGSVTLQTKRSKRDNYNAVKGTFASRDANYILSDYPAITSTTFQEEDGGDRQFLDYNLPYTVSSPMAQRLAKIALFRNRQQISITYPCNLKGFQLDVGDTVMINNTTFGFSSKVFEVAEWSLSIDNSNGSPTLGTNLVLRELNDAVFDWDAEEKEFLLDNSNLPDPFTVSIPTLTLSDELRVFNEEAINVLVAELSTSDALVLDFEVEAKKSTDSKFINMGMSSSTRFELYNVEDSAIYNVRARAISRFSNSPFVEKNHEVVGKTEPPSDVTNFQINIVNTEAHLSWTPVPDLDLSHYIIRHSPLTSGATFNNAITLVDKVSRPANTVTVPALTGTYFVRAVDKIQLLSLNATSNVALIENIKNLNLIATSTQNPDFTGTKTNVVAIDGGIILDTTTDFDDATGNFDDAIGSFDGGNGSVASSGIYEFDAPIDVAGVYTNRITARVESERIDYVNVFDDATGNFDQREGLFEGTSTSFGNTNVEFQIATTQTDPASGSSSFTSFQKFIVGDYKARGFKFRAILTSGDLNATPKITNLSVTVDMPERTYSQNDIASGTDTSGKVVTFTPAFKAIQGVGISASNLASGDYYAITSKSATGFTIEFFNSSNATIDRTFDYVVRGYGELAS